MTDPTLIRLPNGHLALETEQGPQEVTLYTCFPWTSPDKYLSLRDKDGRELYFLEDPGRLDSSSKALVNEELGRRTGTFVITAIHTLRKELELRCWEVITQSGPRSFQTELDVWPRELPGGAYLIEDLFGDLYTVTSLEDLDPSSAKLFWPLIG